MRPSSASMLKLPWNWQMRRASKKDIDTASESRSSPRRIDSADWFEARWALVTRFQFALVSFGHRARDSSSRRGSCSTGGGLRGRLDL